jgi:hypothetical protein
MDIGWGKRAGLSFIVLGFLLGACDSAGGIEPSKEPVVEQQIAQTPVPSSSELTAPGKESFPLNLEQVQMAACGPEFMTEGSSVVSVPWKSLQPYAALNGIERISSSNEFDAAGYGWKPGSSYAFSDSGEVWAWGYLGENVAFPSPMEGLEKIREISEPYVLTADSQVWRMERGKAPAKIEGLIDVVSIRYTLMHGILYALKKDGSLWQLPSGSAKLMTVQSDRKLMRLYGSAFSLFALGEDGVLVYMDGKSGGDIAGNAYPIEADGDIERVAVGYEDQALLQTKNGDVYWFQPDEKKLSRVESADGAKAMAIAGRETYLYAQANGTVWGWGENRNGLLGADKPFHVEEQVQIEGLSDVVELSAGTDHAIALDSSGHVYSWGSNMTGQLGRIPVLFEQRTELGEYKDIQQLVTSMERPYLVRTEGSIWRLQDDRTLAKVEGPAGVSKLDSIYGVPITLGSDGVVRLWPDRFTACRSLALPFQVKDIVAGEGELLLRGAEDRLAVIRFKPEMSQRGDRYFTSGLIVEKVEVVRKGADWGTGEAGKVSLYSSHYTFLALTDEGNVYYLDSKGDESAEFKPVAGLAGVRSLAPQYFVRYTHDPAVVWALDDNNRVHEVIFKVHPNNGKLKISEVNVSMTNEEPASAISGRLRMTKDGQLYEKDWPVMQRQQAPEGIRLISSSYQYAIEGPGMHYHLLWTLDGKLSIIGYNPLGSESAAPGKVLKGT